MVIKLKEIKKEITYEEFIKNDIRVGRITEVYVDHEEGSLNKFYVKVDFGDAGIMNSEIELTNNYNVDALECRLVIAIVNVSTDADDEAIILKIASNDGKDVLIRPDWEVPPGCRVL